MSKNIDVHSEPIDDQANHEWTTEIDTGNGYETIEGVVRARFVNYKRDQQFVMGKSADGNYTNVTRRGGGGAVNVLYSISPEGRLWIGGVMQRRRNISDDLVFNLVRGYNRPNEDNQSAALREAIEETGRTDLMVPIRLPGESVNADSAMNDSVHGGGVDLYRVEVPFEALVQNENGTMSFDTKDLTEEQLREGIYQVVFQDGTRMSSIAGLADGFTLAGYLRLRAFLEDEMAKLPSPSFPYSVPD